MSSPLSMLKKTRRTPLQGQPSDQRDRQRLPFRMNLLKEFQSQLAENDDESSDQNRPTTSKTSASAVKAPSKTAAPPSDFELMSIMTQRVSLLEKTVKTQEQKIKQKDKRIWALEKKLRRLKDSESTHDWDNAEKCQQLQNQVCEMESFLKDHGLIWVGDDGKQPRSSERSFGQLDATEVRSFHMNFDLVLQSIEELNVLAGEGECYVQMTATGGQLARKDPIQLSLYSNGIVMFQGPFRSYQEQSTQQCMQDLMDGYFPSELQDRFPDGVPIQVHDRRHEEFISRPQWSKFPGQGQTVGGEKDESSHHRSVVSSQLSDRKLSMDQFLSRIPRLVVKACRVIDVRDSLRTTLQGSSNAQSSSSLILVETPALQAMKERLQTPNSERPSSAHDVITLKLKSEDGNHTYMIKMSSSDTVGHLRAHLDKHRGAAVPGYDIISVYPQCCYDEDSRTLKSCGLTTNATLLLQKRKHVESLTEVIE